MADSVVHYHLLQQYPLDSRIQPPYSRWSWCLFPCIDEAKKNCKKSQLCHLFSGKAFGLLTVAMVIRVIVTFLVVSGNNLSIKDKLFVAIAWSPKATVQVNNRVQSSYKQDYHQVVCKSHYHNCEMSIHIDYRVMSRDGEQGWRGGESARLLPM